MAVPTVPTPGRAAPASVKPTRLASLRVQMSAATAVLMVLLVLGVLPLAASRIDRGFDDFERNYGEQEVDRLTALLEDRAAQLERVAMDYSQWDEAAAFVAGQRPDFLEDKITNETFERFSVDLVAVMDAEQRRVAERHAPAGVPAGLFEAVMADPRPCIAAQATRRAQHAFSWLLGEAWLVTCVPVSQTRVGDAAPVGTMLWVEALDSARLADIGRLTRYPFVLRPPAEAGLAPAVELTEEKVVVSLPVHGVAGERGVAARMWLEHPLAAQRHLTTTLILSLLAAALVLPPLLMLLMAERFVVQRIHRVSRWVRTRLDTPGALTAEELAGPAGGAGNAELAMLTRDFGTVVQRLDIARQQWQDEAMSDSLTGLGNRAALLNALAIALADEGATTGLMMLDLDGFKPVNDLLGHPAGDALLNDVAQAVEDLLPLGGKAFRVGGDEFAVVLRHTDEASALALAARCCDGLSMTRHSGGKPLAITASIGVALATTAEPLTVSELLSRADLALYEVKRRGRRSFTLFSPQTHAAYREHIELESGLRAALLDNRIIPWFQPIVAARDGRPLAIEALARWHEPGRGWVEPTRFVAAAERSNQVASLDACILEAALAVFAPLRARYPDLRLNVNVSAQSLMDRGYLTRLEHAFLAQSTSLRSAVSLELTESDLGIRIDQLEEVLAGLNASGLQLIVDDFGVGASSLSRLTRIVPRAVKIDGSFVRDLYGDGGRICRAIVELARELGMQSVAEYVEDERQFRMLAAMGCNGLQGYAISRALSPPEIGLWLGRQQARLERDGHAWPGSAVPPAA